MSNLQRCNSYKEKMPLFIKMKNEILTLQNNANEKYPDYFNEIVYWIDSKIEKRDFASIVRERQAKSFRI